LSGATGITDNFGLEVETEGTKKWLEGVFKKHVAVAVNADSHIGNVGITGIAVAYQIDDRKKVRI